MSDLLLIGGVVLLIGLATLVLRRREGRVSAAGPGRVDAELRRRLGVPTAGTLLLELTAPACTSCEAARRVLDRVAAARPDVHAHAVDVGDVLDLAREHQVMRAPTTLVVGPDGAVRAKVGGVPDPERLAALLDAADPAADAA